MEACRAACSHAADSLGSSTSGMQDHSPPEARPTAAEGEHNPQHNPHPTPRAAQLLSRHSPAASPIWSPHTASRLTSTTLVWCCVVVGPLCVRSLGVGGGGSDPAWGLHPRPHTAAQTTSQPHRHLAGQVHWSVDRRHYRGVSRASKRRGLILRGLGVAVQKSPRLLRLLRRT